MKSMIKTHLRDAIAAKEHLLENQMPLIEEIGLSMLEAVKKGKKIIVFGNGGSAADAQHLAAELVGRYKRERRPVEALALSTNTSNITAIANDYGFDNVFLRQLWACAKKGDVALGISTSGNSPNVLKALGWASENGLITISLTSEKASQDLKKYSRYCLCVNSVQTPVIQEAHICCIHIFCGIIESGLDV